MQRIKQKIKKIQNIQELVQEVLFLVLLGWKLFPKIKAILLGNI